MEKEKRCKRCGGKLTYNPKTENGMPKGWYCETCGEAQLKRKGEKR